MKLSDGIESIKGIGPKTCKLYARLGVFTVNDLVTYYPKDYEVYEELQLYSIDKTDRVIAVYCKVMSAPSISSFNRKTVVTCRFTDERGNVFWAKWYNQPFLRGVLKTGESFVLRGKLVFKKTGRYIEQPQIFSKEKYLELSKKMLPIYPLTKGLSRASIIKNLQNVFELLNNSDADIFESAVPESAESEFRLMPYKKSVEEIHFPKDEDSCKKARERIVFEEFFVFFENMTLLKNKYSSLQNHFIYQRKQETDDFIDNLPFELTDDQKNVIETIRCEMSGTGVMHRMLQGDVGSGKTIVAFTAMIENALNGYQSAFMAPTEVLANQHYNEFSNLIKASGMNILPCLLTGSVSGSQRKSILQGISDGTIQVIIGTHALFQDKVIYNNLSLVITDEQHRFGVIQRERLGDKGIYPHSLFMSATPIPRSLAGILFAGFDVSILSEKPKKRLPVKSCVVDTAYRNNAYSFIKREIEKGHQAYIICPMVEESELIPGENVLDYSQRMTSLFSSYNVGVLHGRMTSDEKRKVMDDFSSGKIMILVSTTVVEVGVDVPNATVIMIEDAQRFGLAQLHQLRGRVGRGDCQSYCIFVDTMGNPEDNQRLQVLNKSDDGFYIAGEDLRLRGPGDLFGIRQSGEIGFKLADIYKDCDVMKLAYELCTKCTKNK